VRARLGEPVATEVQRFARNVADISATLKAQSHRVEGAVDRVENAVDATTSTLQQTANFVSRAVRSGVRPLVEVGALWQAVKRGIGAYRALRPASVRIEAVADPSEREMDGPHEEWEERHANPVEH
jgi:hypothetical protein